MFNDRPDVAENNKTYKLLIQQRDSIENLLLAQLATDEITKNTYVDRLRLNTTFYKEKIKECNKEKREIIRSFSFNGRNSFHYWLFVFGLSISFFFLAIRYTYRINIDYKNKHLKKSLIVEASAWIAVSLFWVIHSVFVQNADLPTPVYAGLMFSVCLLIGVSIFYFIKYLIHRKTHTIESYKNSIINLISLISDIRINHYFHMAAKAQNKDNEEIIKKDVEIVEEKIFSTLEKVADES